MRLFNYIAHKLWPGALQKSFTKQSNKQRAISTPVVHIAIGSIALGMAVMLLTLAIVTGFKNEVSSRAIGFAGHVVVHAYTDNNSYEQEPISIQSDFIKDLIKNLEIKHVQPFATKNAMIKTSYENQGIILKGVDGSYDWKFIQQYLQEGAIPSYNDSISSDKIVVSGSVATKLGIKPGDKLITYFVSKKNFDSLTTNNTFEYRVRKFVVSGIYQTGFSDVDDNIVFADLKQVQRLNYWSSNQAGGFEIELKDLKKLDQLTEEINGLIGQGLEARSVKALYPTLFSWLDLLNSNASIIIILMVAVTLINMISALLILILEKSNTIGLLKALGAGNALVQKVFLYQSMRMLVKGLVIGNLAGICLIALQLRFKLVALDPKTYYVSYVPVELHMGQAALLNGLTIISCLITMLLPVLVISKITPVKSLKFK